MNTNTIPKHILNAARKNVHFGRDPFTDDELNKMSKTEILNHYLNWQGLLERADFVKETIENIWGIQLDD